MSNRAFLIGNNTPGTPGIEGDGINYDPDTEILAGASNSIPIFWCSLFEESNLVYHHLKGYEIPTLVSGMSDAKARYATRIEQLESAFPDFCDEISCWTKFVNELSCEYIKVDSLEIFMLHGNELERMMRAAIEYFTTEDPSSLLALTGLAEASYDFLRYQIVAPVDYSLSYILHGYRWIREVPWSDS